MSRWWRFVTLDSLNVYDLQSDIFLLRERVQEAESKDELKEIKKDLSNKVEAIGRSLDKAFNEDSSIDNLESIVNMMKYYSKILEEVEQRLWYYGVTPTDE